MSSSHQIAQKLWNYCNILQDDGLSYGDYPSAESAQGRAGLDWNYQPMEGIFELVLNRTSSGA